MEMPPKWAVLGPCGGRTRQPKMIYGRLFSHQRRPGVIFTAAAVAVRPQFADGGHGHQLVSFWRPIAHFPPSGDNFFFVSQPNDTNNNNNNFLAHAARGHRYATVLAGRKRRK